MADKIKCGFDLETRVRDYLSKKYDDIFVNCRTTAYSEYIIVVEIFNKSLDSIDDCELENFSDDCISIIEQTIEEAMPGKFKMHNICDSKYDTIYTMVDKMFN